MPGTAAVLHPGLKPMKIRLMSGAELWSSRSQSYHQDRLILAPSDLTNPTNPTTSTGSASDSSPFGPNTRLVDDAMRHFSQSLIPADPTNSSAPPTGSPSPPPSPPLSPWNGWGLVEASGDNLLQPSERDKHLAGLAQVLLDRFDSVSINSNIDDEERSQVDEDEILEPVVAGDSGISSQAEPPLKRMRKDNDENLSELWFAWQDKITCTLDILMHLPRSVFSQRQLDLFIWLLKVNDVSDVLSVESMVKLNSRLQKICGIDSIPYKALLGDNPMQSKQESAGGHGTDETGSGSAGSDSEAALKQKKGKGRCKKAVESMSNMLSRIKSFIKIGRPRHKEETTEKLKSYFDHATVVNTKTKVNKMRTEDGIKDNYQMFSLEKLFGSYKKQRGIQAKQEALNAKVKSLPKNTTSPVWRIEGLDPHQDTPANSEVLHVVLLGLPVAIIF